MARKKLYVDNVDLSTFGVYISGQGTFGAPEKSYEFFNVPGRNGDLVSSVTKLQNISVSYDCFICSNFATNIADLRSFLLSRQGYVKITDDYHSGEYRMGVYAGPFDPDVVALNNAGKFTLSFNCMPQRWLTSGQTQQTLSSSPATVTNPTRFNAKPFFLVKGYGSITVYKIGSSLPYRNINIASNSFQDIKIDCENMIVYAGTNTDIASYVETTSPDGSGGVIYNVDFPILEPGTNTINFDNTFTSVKITPRFWEV